MPDWIQRREWITETSYSLYFERAVPHTGGWAFDCDADGNVDIEALKDKPLALEAYKECLRGHCQGEGVKPPVVQEYTNRHLQPAILRCACGEEVALWSSWANTCEKCGQEFNGSGQRLAPRHQWGEETGERFACACGNCDTDVEGCVLGDYDY